MSEGLRCDGPGCGKFDADACGWWILGRHKEIPSVMAALGIGKPKPLTFCSALCVAGYCYVVAVTEGPATGTEPAGKLLPKLKHGLPPAMRPKSGPPPEVNELGEVSA